MRALRSAGSRTALERDVGAAQAGDVAAFERIYHRFAPAVAAYLRWNGVIDVESLANEVMAQIHRGLPQFTGDAAAFRSWVFTIAHHRMVDDRRAEGRRPVVVDSASFEDGVVGDVEEDALDALSDDGLRQLLDGLSPDQRAVLLLRVVADLSLDDVAHALGKPPGAIKSLQHRALAALRRQLEREKSDT
ncbi:MAG: RNA polymerase sigma factor [Microthrixaceae bacterium]